MTKLYYTGEKTYNEVKLDSIIAVLKSIGIEIKEEGESIIIESMGETLATIKIKRVLNLDELK